MEETKIDVQAFLEQMEECGISSVTFNATDPAFKFETALNKWANIEYPPTDGSLVFNRKTGEARVYTFYGVIELIFN